MCLEQPIGCAKIVEIGDRSPRSQMGIMKLRSDLSLLADEEGDCRSSVAFQSAGMEACEKAGTAARRVIH
ncbi:hypothetical protein DF3PB_1210001 [uncultured Defluviicoccus sp.]|nr:hypothetical protein DF3PB_1210001 [uncultured Defluviicoccus sp.]